MRLDRARTFLTIIALLLISIVKKSQAYLLLTQTSFLDSYAYFKIIIHNDLLPIDANTTLKIATMNNADYNSSTSPTGTTVYSTQLNYQQNSSQYSTWNYQTIPQQIIITISSPINITINQNLILMGPNSVQSMFVAILTDYQTNPFILPFNLLNTKLPPVFVVAYDTSMKQNTYNLAPFMSTYWTQNKITASILPWLPYFSQCSYQQNYIILNDLIMPEHCHADNLQTVLCQSKQLTFNCIIEELQVTSVSSEYWFNQVSNIIYYLYPTPLGQQELDALRNNNDNLTALIDTFYAMLIPVIYKRQSSDQIIVNTFTINIKVKLNQGALTELIYIEIIGGYDPTIASPYGSVTVNVDYSNVWAFIYYGLQTKWYILFCILVVALLFLILFTIHKRFGFIDVIEKGKLLLAPGLKGVIYSLLTAGIFAIIMHLIPELTNYSAIFATFDSDYTGQTLASNNNGRYGLTMFFSGLFILMSGIKQTFKVNESEQLKIAFEDDKWKFQTAKELSEKIQYSKINLFSYRRFLFIGLLIPLALLICITFYFTLFSNPAIALCTVLAAPLLTRIYLWFEREYLIRSNIIICALMIAIDLIYALAILKNQTIYELVYLYIAKYLSLFYAKFAIELAIDYIFSKVEQHRHSNRFTEYLYLKLEHQIQMKNTESQYEKALSYCLLVVSSVATILIYPFFGFFLFLTEASNQMPSLFMVTDLSMVVPFILYLIALPVQLYTVMLLIEFFKTHYAIRIEQAIKFNHFKFARTKFRWMNDVFAHSKDIREEFRQFQKFAFSSQLYFVISIIALGIQFSVLGAIIMVKEMYLPFYDPATLIIMAVVWGIGQILSVVVSVIAIKLKLYEKKQADPIRQKLGKVQKYLTVNNNEEYLQLNGVKDYFMLYNKDWIICNLNRIFTKQDLRQKNGELINQYKSYKSNFKRKQIEEKKKLKQQKLQSHKMKTNEELFRQPFKIFKNQHIFSTAKPTILYWYYLAKQNLYLKEIVNCVKREMIKPVCEFCNMDVELQALERNEFHNIINTYRIENVGKLFDRRAFLEYYRLHQQYITICLECKQKNLHIQTKINTKNAASKLIFYWLLIARSNLLHKQPPTPLAIK